jgi:4-methyl-5(b-hydroxyethyl)-thiazole monophosphate biosynthesis
MSSGVLFLADGFEEIEAVTVIDILRRAGITLTTCSINQKEVVGAHQINLIADQQIKDFNADKFTFMVLPGGMGGTLKLIENSTVIGALKKFKHEKKLIAAICAAPMVLDHADVLPRKFVCYPSIEKKLKAQGYSDQENVQYSENVLTSKGPATATEFALNIVSIIIDDQAANRLAEDLLFEVRV